VKDKFIKIPHLR